MAAAPEVAARAEQVARYEFRVEFPGATFPSWTVDEPPPVGADHGPNPVRVLAASVAHCMSSTLLNSLERARVATGPIATTVRAQVGPNPRGRRRVLALDVSIETAPLHEEDRERFDRCVAIFEDYCTVSGAVREGIRIDSRVRPPGTGSGGP